MNDEEWRNAEDDAAALWVARHLSSAVDTMAFKQWLAGHPDREARFAALWETCMDEAVTKGLRAHDHTPPGEAPRNPINAIAPPPYRTAPRSGTARAGPLGRG